MNLKEKKYLLLDLDGVCYGKHNNYSLERVFGQVSKRMTQFISEKLKIDKDKANLTSGKAHVPKWDPFGPAVRPEGTMGPL